jgi:hypothetical protein
MKFKLKKESFQVNQLSYLKHPKLFVLCEKTFVKNYLVLLSLMIRQIE